ncbi:MAG TPA: hypothetical protein VGJ28_17555 [Micromonosporaceae bacterium]|jgi:hypothetical protein
MSAQNAPLPEPTGLFLEPGPASPAAVRPPSPAVTHHQQPEPAEHLCTCGKVREACVHDEIRAFWASAFADPGPDPTAPSSKDLHRPAG